MSSKRIATYLFFFSLLVLGTGYAFTKYPILKVSYIEVLGSAKLSPTDVPVSVGENLLTVDLGNVVGSMMRHSFIATAAARADQYGKITVTVTEKQPVSYVYLNRLYGVTSRCELLPEDLNAAGRHLPIIRGLNIKSPVSFTIIDDPALRAAVALIETLKSRYPRSYDTLSEILLSGNDLDLIFEPGSIVVHLGWGDYDMKIQHIERILESNKNPGLDIDLRFADLAVLKSRVSKDREVNNGI